MSESNTRRQFAMDTLSTAIESSIAYWAEGQKFHRQPKDEDGHCRLYIGCDLRPHNEEGPAFPDGDPRNDWQTITVGKILTAADLIVSEAGVKLCRADIRSDIHADLTDPDSCRSDAETADVIVQIALFGEVVFG